MDEFKVVIDETEEVIQEVKKQSQTARSKDQGIIDQADKFNKSIDELNKDLSAIYAKKDEMRESHYEALYKFELQRDELRYNGDVKRKKELLMRGEKELNERIEKKREQLANRANPNEGKIDACEQAVKYCNSLKKKFGLVAPSTEEVAQATQKEINKFDQQAGLQKKLENKSI